jgi:hypothetical protein
MKHRQRNYGKPLPPKRQIKAHLKFFESVAGENNDTNESGNKVRYRIVDGRVTLQKGKTATRDKS